jgi:hypothetical protein
MSISILNTLFTIMGILGYLVTLFINIDKALSLGSTACVQTIGEAFWPIAIAWVVPAFGLLFIPYHQEHRWFRVGLVVGIATWLVPVVITTAYSSLNH